MECRGAALASGASLAQFGGAILADFDAQIRVVSTGRVMFLLQNRLPTGWWATFQK
jgi:hypothetical protein